MRSCTSICTLRIIVTHSLVQLISMGSGSHFPFPIHVVVLGPVNISPGGQVKVTFAPSTAGSL